MPSCGISQVKAIIDGVQPHAWVTSMVQASMKAEPVPTSLLLLNGFPILHLQIEVILICFLS